MSSISVLISLSKGTLNVSEDVPNELSKGRGFLGVVVHPGKGPKKTAMNAVDVAKDAFWVRASGDITMNEACFENLCHVLSFCSDG